MTNDKKKPVVISNLNGTLIKNGKMMKGWPLLFTQLSRDPRFETVIFTAEPVTDKNKKKFLRTHFPGVNIIQESRKAIRIKEKFPNRKVFFINNQMVNGTSQYTISKRILPHATILHPKKASILTFSK